MTRFFQCEMATIELRQKSDILKVFLETLKEGEFQSHLKINWGYIVTLFEFE